MLAPPLDSVDHPEVYVDRCGSNLSVPMEEVTKMPAKLSAEEGGANRSDQCGQALIQCHDRSGEGDDRLYA